MRPAESVATPYGFRREMPGSVSGPSRALRHVLFLRKSVAP